MNGDTDGLQQMVRALGEALYNEPGEKPLPMASTDAEEVIKAQLTENTGTHFLDSGSAYGRHWEENQDNPPWEQPTFDVGGSGDSGFVVKNVYDYMSETFARDRTCVALEAALYAYAHTDDRKRDAWLTCMEGFAEGLIERHFTEPMLRSLGLEDEFVREVLSVQSDVSTDDTLSYSRRSGPEGPFTHNTYNSEFGSLTQCLQGTNLGGPYADYVLLQVHQGADVRGGYTGPRVYEVWDSWVSMEFQAYCPRCEWSNVESCLYDYDGLAYYRDGVDRKDLFERLRERTDDEIPDNEIREWVGQIAEEAADDDYMDGAVVHVADGCGGLVRF